jgi:hypothetical protein
VNATLQLTTSTKKMLHIQADTDTIQCCLTGLFSTARAAIADQNHVN